MRYFIQDLSLNIYSYFHLFLHGSSSSFEKRRYHELLDRRSACFNWCIKECMNLNGTEILVEMDRKNFEKDQKSVDTVLKIWQKNSYS